MIKFYYNTAPNPTKVALCLEEMGLPYELVPVDTRKGEQHTPAFLAINPNAKVPVIVDDDATVFDSNAILLYLAEKTGKFLPGKSPQGAGRDAVVADVRRLGHRALFGPVRALPELRARAEGIRGQPLHLRGPAPLGHPRGAAGQAPLHVRRRLQHRRHGGVGLVAADPQRVGPEAPKQLPNLQRHLAEISARPAAARALALKDKHTFKTEMDDAARLAMFPHLAKKVA